jgi:putative tryptophan/tyrosine transport system substrate-binding protein
MTRRTIGLLITLALLVAPLAAQAQPAPKVFRVGLLSTANPRSAPQFVAFAQRLRELGYVEGQNFAFEFRNAAGQVERLANLAAELVRLPVDVMVAAGPEVTLQAARQATSTLPIVMVAIYYDPLARGYIDGLARPGGNLTGVFFLQLELTAKRLELLKEVLPQVTRVSALWDVHTADQLRASEAAAQSLELQLHSVELRNPPDDGFEGAIGVAVRERAQALVVLSSPMFLSKRAEIAAVALKHRLPTIFLFREYVEAGGLMAYGANLSEMWRRAADYVAKIFKGAKPADLPVEQPMTFELAINLKTAQALGLTIPPTLLFQADEVIR